MNFVQNITKGKQEIALKDVAGDLLQMLLKIKDYAVVTLNADGFINDWNAGAERFYGYSAEEIVGKYVAILYTAADAARALPEINLKRAANAGSCEFEILKRKRNGKEFYTKSILNALYDADRKLIGFAKITQDIDVKKRLEKTNAELQDQLEEKVKQRTKELVMVNKELEAFSYSVSHDLRVPLRAISGYSNLLKKKYETQIDVEGNRIIDVITDKTKMMGMLIDDLLAFSKMARLHVVEQRIDMNAMVEACILQLKQSGGHNNYKLTVNELPECSGDESMLKQVWLNLLSNAIKYSSKIPHPEIEIGCNEDEDMNVYYVKDNGAGFDMKYAKNLFGVFQRLHRQDEFEGTGIGLALVKRIITKHTGDVWAEAQLNEGATVYFSIPKT